MDRLDKTASFACSWSTFATIMMLSTAYGQMVKIDISIVTPQSIYPCLDTFDLLITTTNISNTDYVRLIRVYTSNTKYSDNIEKLIYVREYAVPVNNLIKFECHFFSANYLYYCFVFVALSRTNGAVLINGRPHCRQTTMDYSTTTHSTNNYNMNSSLKYEKLRPAGPSYKYKSISQIYLNNIFENSKRISNNNMNNGYDLDEENAQLVTINCECSELFDMNFNAKAVIVSLDILKCNTKQKFDNIDSDRVIEKNANYSRIDSGNYVTQYPTVCVLNLTERKYQMRAILERREKPVIYVESTPVTGLIVRDGRLAIDPQLDANNQSQTHRLNSQYLRIESFYTTNMTLKLILLKSHHMINDNQIESFLSSLSPIHFASMILAALMVIAILVLLLITLTGRKRRTIVKIVTPSEEGVTNTSFSYIDQSSLSQFSLGDNESLEMDYYDYLLPFLSRPNSSMSDDQRDPEISIS